MQFLFWTQRLQQCLADALGPATKQGVPGRVMRASAHFTRGAMFPREEAAAVTAFRVCAAGVADKLKPGRKGRAWSCQAAEPALRLQCHSRHSLPSSGNNMHTAPTCRVTADMSAGVCKANSFL